MKKMTYLMMLALGISAVSSNINANRADRIEADRARSLDNQKQQNELEEKQAKMRYDQAIAATVAATNARAPQVAPQVIVMPATR
jgi:hypothetical protein